QLESWVTTRRRWSGSLSTTSTWRVGGAAAANGSAASKLETFIADLSWSWHTTKGQETCRTARRLFARRASARRARGEFGLPNPWSVVPDWSKRLTWLVR